MNKKQIVFVTSNLGKVKSAQRELKDVEVIQYEAELIEPRSDSIKESGKTIAELSDKEREQYLGKEEQSCFKRFVKWYLKNEICDCVKYTI